MIRKSIKDLIIEMDSTFENGQSGQLVVLENQVELHLNDGLEIIVQSTDSIKLALYKESGELYYHPITYMEALTTMSTEGWPLYAGIKAIVTKGKMKA